jgi:phosphomannomutase/phosphoglucomutase
MKTMEPIRLFQRGEVNSPWKSCDLRGVYPHAVSSLLFRSIGSAIGSMLKPGARAFVAGDFRLSTPELKKALISGLAATGVAVLDGGQMPTPVAYFIGEHLAVDAVLIVTASHNPADHNGLKLMIGGLPTTPEQLTGIRELAESGNFREGHGTCSEIDLTDHYERMMIERWHHLDAVGFPCLVLDAGNGAWSELAPRILKSLGFTLECIACVTDGSFPYRPSDCSRTANLARLREAVAAHPHALGIAWDGDGDRVALVDETGDHVSTDEISLLLAYEALMITDSEAPPKLVVDIKLSDVVRREILAHGGIPLLERTGHAFIRGRMVADQAVLGLDACGHYFHRELRGGDDGLFSALLVLEMLQRANRPLSELRRTLPAIFSTPELRIPVDLLPFGEALERLSAALQVVESVRIDGSRLILNNGIVLVRASGTEPVVSLRIEGFDSTSLDSLIEQCLHALPTAEELLRNQLAEQAQRQPAARES